MTHTDASKSLIGYKAWRASLVALPLGTVIEWQKDYVGVTTSTSIKAGQQFKIFKIDNRMFGPQGNTPDCEKSYSMVIARHGKEMTKKAYWSVENIASRLVSGEVKVIA